jgi:Zn-dependent protease
MLELTLVQKIAVWTLPLLFAITLHEAAHGWVASLFGDQTAKLLGRLTVNPLKHIDPIGTILVPGVLLLMGGFVFGWAKPVPITPQNVRHPRWQMPMISLAGPLANFAMAIVWAAIAKWGMSGLAHYPWLGEPVFLMGEAGIQINILLGILNCLPIPPLDGGHALYYLLPGKMGWYIGRIEPYGFLILVVLLVIGVISFLIAPLYVFMLQWIHFLFAL